MKCYLIYDSYMGSYYYKNNSDSSNAWMGHDYRHACLIENKEEAQKIFRMIGKLSKTSLQLVEVNIPDEEYREIIDGLARSQKAMQYGTAATHKQMKNLIESTQQVHSKSYIGAKDEE